MIIAAHGGPHYPNASTATDPIDRHSFKCPARGCLYNVVKDPREEDEASSRYPHVVATMMAELKRQSKTIWSQPHRDSPKCKKAAWELYNGFYGPFEEVDWPGSAQSEQARFLGRSKL